MYSKNLPGKILIIIFILSLTGERNYSQSLMSRIDSLSWMSGCWSAEHKGMHITEQWMKPEGKTMLGMSRTVTDSITAEYEFIRLWQNENGIIYYTAKPSGQDEASFQLVKISRREAVFENPKHDFPQRIIYRLEADGSLLARIEGIVNGKEKGINFPMKKVICN